MFVCGESVFVIEMLNGGGFVMSLDASAACDVFPSAKHLVMIYTCLSVLCLLLLCSTGSGSHPLSRYLTPVILSRSWRIIINTWMMTVHTVNNGVFMRRLWRAPGPRCVMGNEAVTQILGGHTFTVMLLMVKKLLEACRYFTVFLPRCCDYSWSQIPHETIDALFVETDRWMWTWEAALNENTSLMTELHARLGV